jgi:hypothetical protein
MWFVFRSPLNTLEHPGPSNYLFLVFFCSGILAAGTVLRKKIFPLIRMYFALFILSAVLFVFNPSMVIGFIVSGNPASINPGSVRLYENVFIMQQQSALNPSQVSRTYKITREMGVFHKTLVRDIVLPAMFDSVSAIPIDDPEGVRIRFHFDSNPKQNYLDTVFYFNVTRDSSRIITRKIRK